MLCVYLRGARQETWSAFPAWGERFTGSVATLEPKSDRSVCAARSRSRSRSSRSSRTWSATISSGPRRRRPADDRQRRRRSARSRGRRRRAPSRLRRARVHCRRARRARRVGGAGAAALAALGGEGGRVQAAEEARSRVRVLAATLRGRAAGRRLADVSHAGDRLRVGFDPADEFVHAVATEAERSPGCTSACSSCPRRTSSPTPRATPRGARTAFAARLWPDAASARIGRDGRVPVLEVDGVRVDVDLSLSHHGRWSRSRASCRRTERRDDGARADPQARRRQPG